MSVRLSLALGMISAFAVAALAAPAANKKAPSAPAAPIATPSGPPPLVSTNGMSPSDYETCVADLTSSGVIFEHTGDVKEEGCQLSGAVRLTTVATPFGYVAIAGKPAMLCSFARQFSLWVREVGAPLALAYAGQRLTEIEAASAFSCRARYDKPGAVPSEHAKGDAIDIAAFVLADKRRIRVKPDASDSATTQGLVRALRTTACGYFTTVLGPGTDAAHAEHLHFDTMVHGGIANYRICE
jgi:hypothetical protein